MLPLSLLLLQKMAADTAVPDSVVGSGRRIYGNGGSAQNDESVTKDKRFYEQVARFPADRMVYRGPDGLATAPTEASSMAGVAVAIATTTPPGCDSHIKAMQSCRRESAALERLDCYDRLLAPLSRSR